MSTTTPATLLGVPVQREDGPDDQVALPNHSTALNEATDALVRGPGKKSSDRDGHGSKPKRKKRLVVTRRRRSMDDNLSQSGPLASGLDAPVQPPNEDTANARHEPQQPGDAGIQIGELAHRGAQPRPIVQTAQRQSYVSRLWTGVSSASDWMISGLFVVGLNRASRYGHYFQTFSNSKAMAAVVYVLSALLTGIGIVLFMVLTLTLGLIAAVVISGIILAEDVYQACVFAKNRTAPWFQRWLPKEAVAGTE